MDKFLQFIFLLALSISQCENRELFAPAVPEIDGSQLQKEKPLQTQNNDPEAQIANLNGTLYSNSLSQLNKVRELRIVYNQIREIEAGALCSPPNIKILELDLSRNRNPPLLKKEMFDNCDKLEELFLKLDTNNPSTINQDALRDIPNLKALGIDGLKTQHLKKDFLKLNPNLKKLVLSDVHIATIDSNVFDGLNNLEEIDISHNLGLVSLPLGLFKNTPKVKRLVLRDNAIKDLTWDEFKGLSSLEELDIVDNQIKNFDGDKIAKNLPKLKTFYSEMNPVPCGHRATVRDQLNTKLNRVVDVPDRYGGFFETC